MKDASKEERKRQIAQAAYTVLEKKGFSGASMLAIAKAAKASNETLYRWYGDKIGLFSELVASNAEEVRTQLERELEAKESPLEILGNVGPMLLSVLVGERAIALNRAAAADGTGQLGKAIAKAGRDTIAPLIVQTLLRARDLGELAFEDEHHAAGLYLDLLVGDMQIRRAIGQLPCPSHDEIHKRANTALEQLCALLSPPARALVLTPS
ncbi:TetR/AcrR family transcriptional regulator [Aliiroseovarius marinus]|uniref:TetR/AcrR family transcriptional regulator n=1 Tax=Aliiroseovarius marinus TaxID=2500159 RepID=UPI003D7E3187